MKTKNGMSNIDIVKSYLNNERPFVQVGYKKIEIKRKEGETWTDSSGKTWMQENGCHVQVNKQADMIRKMIEQKCKCGQVIKWGTARDWLFFSKTGLCENCLIDYETKLRIVGVYPSYEKYKLISNEIGFAKDFKKKVEDTIEFFSNNSGDIEVLCNSEGFLEKFKNTNKDDIIKNAKSDLKLVKDRLKGLEKEKVKYKNDYISGAKRFKLETYTK